MDIGRRNDKRQAGIALLQLMHALCEHGHQVTHLGLPAPGKHRHQVFIDGEFELSPELFGGRKVLQVIDQRMPHTHCINARLFINGDFEGQQAEHFVDRFTDPFYTAATPSPH